MVKMELFNRWWKRIDGSYFFGDGYDTSTEYSLATDQEIAQIINDQTIAQARTAKWEQVKTQWDALTVTTVEGNTFAANEEAMRLIAFKANNMGDTAVILWEEDWGSFNTNIVELKEALNLAADAHQTIINSVFGV